jgi:hypothetical protein
MHHLRCAAGRFPTVRSGEQLLTETVILFWLAIFWMGWGLS